LISVNSTIENETDLLTSDITKNYSIEKGLQRQLLSPKKSKLFEIIDEEEAEETKSRKEKSRSPESSSASKSIQQKTPNRFEKNKKKREEITKKLVYSKKDMNDKYFSFLKSYEDLFGKNKGTFQERCRRRQKEIKLQNKLLDKKNRSIFSMYSKTRSKRQKRSFSSVLETFFKEKINKTLNKNNQIMETKK
jgi:hypothetical protein